MAFPKLSVVLPAALGIIAGIASSLLFSMRGDHPGPSTNPAQDTRPNTASREYVPVLVAPSPNQDPLDEVRRRIAALESSSRAPGSPPPARRVGANPLDEQQAMEQQRQATIARHESLVQAHREEPLDPAWGPKTGSLVQSDLNELAKTNSFKVVEADCKTTSCAGTLEWPSYGKALTEWRKLLHHGYQANCGREITLPEPKDPQAPYQATIVLDCEKSRTEGH